MRILFALLMFWQGSVLANAQSGPQCLELPSCLVGEDNEQVPVGTEILVTCETNPETKENVIVRYCNLINGRAEVSENVAIFVPGGC